jgi:hypothetical protein
MVTSNFEQRRPSTLYAVSAASAASGALGMAIYSHWDLQCPLRSIGLACPGCGCGRAVAALVDRGPWAMVRDQPTAAVFLFTWIVVVLGVLIVDYRRVSQRVVGSMVAAGSVIVGLAGLSNLVFQIVR